MIGAWLDGAEVEHLTRRGLHLARFTVAYNILEGAVAVTFFVLPEKPPRPTSPPGRQGPGPPGPRPAADRRTAAGSAPAWRRTPPGNREILAELFERLLGREAEPIPTAPAPTGSTEDQVIAAVEAAAREMLRQEQLARFVCSLPLRHSALLRHGARSTPYVLQQVGQLLERGLAAGDIHNNLPVELLTRHVHSTLETAMRDWAEGRTDDPLTHLRTLLALAFHGIDRT